MRIMDRHSVFPRAALLAALLAVMAGSVASAQEWDWAKEMFEKTTHDFGTVARGAKVEYQFVIENKYEEDVHIASVRSTCGCTNPKIIKPTLKSWEKGAILAVIDTRSFLRQKDATLTVEIDKPFRAEVLLHVHVYIRTDVVVQPGVVQFGEVAQGESVLRKVTVDYAGRGDWQITKVESKNPNLTAKVIETYRGGSAPNKRVTYDLEVSLAENAPVGYIRDQVILVTNDARVQASRVPVPVEGRVVSTIRVSPNPLLLPALNVGASVTKQLAVRGPSGFNVLAVRCDDARIQSSIRRVSETLTLVGVTFAAGTEPEKVSKTLFIKTDQDADKEIEVAVHAQVLKPVE